MKKVSKAKPISQVEIEKKIKTIEQRYAIGKDIQKQCGPTSLPGVIAELAKKYRINRDTAQKLRAIAEPKTGYSKLDLDGWFREFRQAGFALTMSHFVKLISVRNRRTRDALTRRAITHKWSTHRLQAEILARQGRRQTGGRKPTVVSGKAFKAELEQTLWAWNRWLDLHLKANQKLEPELTEELNLLKGKIAEVNRLISK